MEQKEWKVNADFNMENTGNRRKSMLKNEILLSPLSNNNISIKFCMAKQTKIKNNKRSSPCQIRQVFPNH